jgi:ubiquinone/menaquinone biosynthesis C-methylase UbiE
MSDLSSFQAAERFSGLADVYKRHRPDYPSAALDFVMRTCRLRPGAVMVDVGSGTGISSRQFAQRGLRVIGIEPNADMRRQAEAEPSPEGEPPVFRDARAEATGLPGASADAVLAAQAFHWFDLPTTLPEFRRILRPGGWVIVLANERDESDAFTAAYGSVIRSAPEAARVEGRRERVGDPLLASPLFRHGQSVQFTHEQTLDEEAALGRAFSASYAPREPERAAAFAAALRSVFGQYQKAGQVLLKYVTSVTIGQAES